MSAFILFCSGILGELVFKLGDVREQQFARLTQSVRRLTRPHVNGGPA
jgi:hypothetical protein